MPLSVYDLGKLPWMGYRIDNTRERFKKIGLSKQQMNIHKLCQDLPREIGIYLRYVKTMRFTETPDYNYLRHVPSKLMYVERLVFKNISEP